MKRIIYDFTTFVASTALSIISVRYIISGIGLKIQYNEYTEHYYIEDLSCYSWIIISATSLFFLFIWYIGNKYFFPNLYKYRFDKQNKEELRRIRGVFRKTPTYELNDIVLKRRSNTVSFPTDINDEKEKQAEEASIEISRRRFEEEFQKWKLGIIYFSITLIIGFSIGYLWVK